MNKYQEALNRIVSKTSIMNDTCAHLGSKCLKEHTCEYDEFGMCEDYKMVMKLQHLVDKSTPKKPNHIELKEKYSKILEDCHDYRHETHAIKMTIINLMEHFNVSTIEELKNIYINKPYEFEELKRGMHCYVFVNTEVPLSNMKVDALITKICDDKRVEFIFVVENGMVVYKRIPFKKIVSILER